MIRKVAAVNALLGGLLCGCAFGAANDKVTSVSAPAIEQAVTSPDGRKSASYRCTDMHLEFKIISDGKESKVKTEGVPCYEVIALGWTGDSNTIVVMLKNEDGLQAHFIYGTQENNQGFWRMSEVRPPALGNQIATVTECTPGTSTVDMTYGILRHIATDDQSRYWNCHFTVNPATGVFSRLKETPGSQ